ncbi:MAG TPA: hypothetical protein VFA09_03930 [Ktedonobacteraceae bacterium]|jgi:hypothetical protein|nr:hypothetical protein [Ktedonobacteraceae bacterium]
MRVNVRGRDVLPARMFGGSALLLLFVGAYLIGVAFKYITDFSHADFTPDLGLFTSSGGAVLTYHNDTFRSGQNLDETLLNTGNVNVQHFGKLVSYPVDGQVYTQPLFVPHLGIRGRQYNVVYVATENDSVYAFDADQRHAEAPLWKTSFLHPSSVTSVPATDLFKKYPHQDIEPFVGITGTPVIDRAANTMYVVAMTKERGYQYVQRLHALDITTGKDRAGSPVTISAFVKGKGYDRVNASSSLIALNSKQANQRPALLLANGVIYIAWAGFGDTDPYHGWVIGYTYDGRAFRQVAVYNTTPDGQEGGVWMGGAGPAADTEGNVYLTVGNGSFDLAQQGQRDAGDSFVKLNTRNGLVLSDYFTPFNQACLSGRDGDLGAGGVLLLPEQLYTIHPNLLIGVGKEGRIYVLDRDHMGGFHGYAGASLQCGSREEGRTDIDQVLQELPASSTDSFFGIPAYWVGTATSGQLVYVGEAGDHLKAFQLNGDTLSARATAQTAESYGYPGATPSISSNARVPGSGIVWVISPANCDGPGCVPSGPGVLRAYDATNIGRELYNSEQDAARDGLDSYVKFSVPTIAGGKVFVGTQTSLTIYGLETE